jgi:hypothetical protein
MQWRRRTKKMKKKKKKKYNVRPRRIDVGREREGQRVRFARGGEGEAVHAQRRRRVVVVLLILDQAEHLIGW